MENAENPALSAPLMDSYQIEMYRQKVRAEGERLKALAEVYRAQAEIERERWKLLEFHRDGFIFGIRLDSSIRPIRASTRPY